MYEMKESGIEWIGQIPKHWEVRKVKYIVQSINGYAFNSVLYSDSGNCSIVRIGDICDSQIKYENVVKINANAQYLSKFKICKNDILFAMSGATVGKIGYVSEDVYNYFINQRVAIIRYKYNKFVYFFLSTNCFSEYVKLFAIGSAQPNISLEYFNDFYITFPPLDEQKKIADFLDNKVTEIDNLIDDTKKLIDKYKEYKQSLITETLTKGLYSNVEMKDSGIEWIDNIPKHWEVNKLKYLFIFGKGLPITKEDLKDSGISVISYGQIHSKLNNGIINDNLIRYVDDIYLKLEPKSLVNKGDFIFADTSEDYEGCGNNVYINKDITLFAGYHTIILKSKKYQNNKYQNNKYLSYLFQTDIWRKQIRSKVFGIKLFSITQKILKETSVIFPPLDEQEEIVKYLDDKCSQIDSIIEEKQSLIEKLEEYKKSLIYEYVTGKKQV